MQPVSFPFSKRNERLRLDYSSTFFGSEDFALDENSMDVLVIGIRVLILNAVV